MVDTNVVSCNKDSSGSTVLAKGWITRILFLAGTRDCLHHCFHTSPVAHVSSCMKDARVQQAADVGDHSSAPNPEVELHLHSHPHLCVAYQVQRPLDLYVRYAGSK